MKRRSGVKEKTKTNTRWPRTGLMKKLLPYKRSRKGQPKTPKLRSVSKIETPSALMKPGSRPVALGQEASGMKSELGGKRVLFGADAPPLLNPSCTSTPYESKQRKLRCKGKEPAQSAVTRRMNSSRLNEISASIGFIPLSPRTLIAKTKGFIDPPIVIDETQSSLITLDRTGEVDDKGKEENKFIEEIDLRDEDEDDEDDEVTVLDVKEELSKARLPCDGADSIEDFRKSVRERKVTSFPAMGIRVPSRSTITFPSTSKSTKENNRGGGRRFSNIMVGSSNASAPRRGDLKPIVIDGQNVAVHHAVSCGLGPRFSSRGIDMCVEYFKRRGHEVVVFVPQSRTKSGQADDRHLLEKLMREGVLSFTPSRTLQHRQINSYDDRFIVQYAAIKGGIVVSNDNYEDLRQEDRRFQDVIANRLLKFTWAHDILMFPNDPMGRDGPSFEKFLRF